MTNPNSPLPVGSPTSANSPTSKSAAFRVIAYVTDAIVPATIRYDELTHINYAFLIPNDDGTFQALANSWKIGEIIDQAHQHGVKVLISVGGWGWDAQFETMAAEPATRTAFVQNLVEVVEQYQFDGADMDWEYPDPGQSSQNFLNLMQELRTALPEDKLLTMAIVALGDEHGLGIPAEVFSLVDFANIMAYDSGGAQHSSMEYAQSSLDYWLARGLLSTKTVLGVPFYARPVETPYWKIVKADPAAAQLDSFDYDGISINYNGIPTIQAKTRLAMQRGSGIMFWNLDSDAPGDLSLLNAIHQVVVNSGN
jgi:chitinase